MKKTIRRDRLGSKVARAVISCLVESGAQKAMMEGRKHYYEHPIGELRNEWENTPCLTAYFRFVLYCPYFLEYM